MENKFQFYVKIKSITTFDDGDDYFYEEGEHNDVSIIDIVTSKNLPINKFHLLLEPALIPMVIGLKLVRREEVDSWGWTKVYFFETTDGINYHQVNPDHFCKMVNICIEGN